MNISVVYDELQQFFGNLKDCIVIALCIILLLGLYAFPRVSIFTIARRRALRFAWLAWVPVCGQFVLGSISDQYRFLLTGKKTHRRVWLIIIEAVYVIVNLIACVWILLIIAIGIGIGLWALFSTGLFALSGGGVNLFNVLTDMDGIEQVLAPSAITVLLLLGAIILRTVFHSMALWDLYRSCRPQSSTLFLVLSIFFPPLKPLFLFLCRKEDQGMPVQRF